MTSVRPKLKPDTPKGVTAWQTETGHNVWMTASGEWTRNVGELAAFIGEAAEEALAKAQAQEGIVTDPYFMEVTASGKITGREALRETIRAAGPTVAYGEQS